MDSVHVQIEFKLQTPKPTLKNWHRCHDASLCLCLGQIVALNYNTKKCVLHLHEKITMMNSVCFSWILICWSLVASFQMVVPLWKYLFQWKMRGASSVCRFALIGFSGAASQSNCSQQPNRSHLDLNMLKPEQPRTKSDLYHQCNTTQKPLQITTNVAVTETGLLKSNFTIFYSLLFQFYLKQHVPTGTAPGFVLTAGCLMSEHPVLVFWCYVHGVECKLVFHRCPKAAFELLCEI